MQLNVKRVFTDEQEAHIEEYAIKIARMFYGLPAPEFRKLVYVYAVAVGSKAIPEIWKEKGQATRDWYYAYMKRHPTLALKVPEGMSIARAMAFNRVNVENFFNAYTEALSQYNFIPERIFNMDESGLSTVMKPTRGVCERGRPVASQIAEERGKHMTFVGFINAAGHYIPPVFIVARRKMKAEFLRGTIDGSTVLMHPTGWMTHDGFLETLKHFCEKTRCSLDDKVLLIIDNAECHMTIHAVEYAIQHGIVIVTLPPHTTAKLQPLDVSIFGPFKVALRSIQDGFKLANPNVAITEYMLPQMASTAWIQSCTPVNVLSGFSATGIWPVNRNIFPDEAFAGAEVSERELPQEPPVEEAHSSPDDVAMELPDLNPGLALPSASGRSSPDDPVPGPSGVTTRPTTPAALTRSDSGSSTQSTPGRSITPEDLRPLPRGPPRPVAKGRPTIKSCILTQDEGALAMLREKDEKKVAKEEKKKQQEERKKEIALRRYEKKKQVEAKKKEREEKKKEKEEKKKEKENEAKKKNISKKRKREEEDSTDEEPEPLPRLSDSSDFEEDFQEEPVVEGPYPFAEKQPEVRELLKYLSLAKVKFL